MDVVPLVGVYSTEAHPFGLVYEYLDGRDLKQHLRNVPNAGRLELVLLSIPTNVLPFNLPIWIPTVDGGGLRSEPDA